ncbi:efflux RND transporter periplasmic adaptor subunit [Streptomyces sp. NPDC020983]|uniref:efflux RND transporter periplasmic adaptor subunit n=1 Tax=Streptomyces sp. NPDC020983 TaxID=3365106 RepID=UPI0037BC110D
MKVLPRRRRAALINSVLGVVVLAGAGGAYAAVHDDGAPSSGSGTARVATVSRGTVSTTVSGSGSLVSPSDAGLNFTTGGTLTEVKVKPGDKVTKGQVLAKVDATDAKATLQQDEATLDAAEANLTKVEAGEVPASSSSDGTSGRSGGQSSPTPAPTPTVDPVQLAQAQAQLTQAQNAVDAARRAVDGTTLKAPVAGTVASVGGAKGDTVSGTSGSGSGSGGSGGSGSSSAGSSSSSSSPSGFIVLTNPANMQVTANFSEADSLKIKAGQPATVTLNAQSGTVLDAKVLSISSLPASSSSASGGGSGSSGSAVQYPAVLQITGDTSGLRTGLSAAIQVTTATATDVLTVPTAAVSGTGSNRTVLVVGKDGSTTRTPVTVGVEGDSADQITAGLTEGQQVQIPRVASSGSNGFPSGAFPGGVGSLGGGSRFGAAGGGAGGGFRQGAGGR